MSDIIIQPRSRKPPRSAGVRPSGKAPAKISGIGVASSHFHGRLKSILRGDLNAANIIEMLEVGLPVTALMDLQAGLDVPVEKLAPMLGVSKATFHRRKGAGQRLGTAESERVVRFARLLGKAVKVFTDMEDAKQWLNSPQFGLGGAVPLDYAKTEVGAREVENLLGRIEYGVYS